MTSKAKSKQEEALKFLDDLDSFTPSPQVNVSDTIKPAGGHPNLNNEGEAEVLAFLDEITQKSVEPTRPTAATPHLDRPVSRSGTPTLRKGTGRVRVGGSASSPSASSSSTSLSKAPTTAKEKGTPDQATASGASGPWGWGSVWSTASAAIQQAKTAVDEQVKALPNNEQARKWGEGVIGYAKSAQLDKIGSFPGLIFSAGGVHLMQNNIGQDFRRVGLSTLTDILNVVAPPISEHEVIQVWLSHEMQGYDGIESLVYRALARVCPLHAFRSSCLTLFQVMEQVEGGDLIVNRGDESRPKNSVTEGEISIPLKDMNLR